jgi:hypothetical protein
MMVRRFGLLILFAMLLLAACSPERKLAKVYVKNHNGNAIMITPLYELYKDNLTISYDTAIKYSPGQFDSIAWEQSVFIKKISDSVFLTTFTNSMIAELTQKGYDVYVDGSSDVFFGLPDPKWIIQIAQLQMNEKHKIHYYEMYSVETGEPVQEGLRVNYISLESWLEVNRANTGNKQVLYLDSYIRDDISSKIDLNIMEGSVGVEQKRDSLNMTDLYRMAQQSGQKHAQMLFDYFMNDYIRENLPAGINNRQYFHFDNKSKSIERGLKERFEVVN